MFPNDRKIFFVFCKQLCFFKSRQLCLNSSSTAIHDMHPSPVWAKAFRQYPLALCVMAGHKMYMARVHISASFTCQLDITQKVTLSKELPWSGCLWAVHGQFSRLLIELGRPALSVDSTISWTGPKLSLHIKRPQVMLWDSNLLTSEPYPLSHKSPLGPNSAPQKLLRTSWSSGSHAWVLLSGGRQLQAS